MAKAKVKITDNQIGRLLDQMSSRAQSAKTFFNRSVYPRYQNAQRTRWMTENDSQGSRWTPLNSKYAEYKKKKYAAEEGRGEKMLIATGSLYKSVIGPGEGHRKVVTDRSIEIATTLKYAPYVAEKRPFMEFGPKFYRGIRDSLVKFILKGQSVTGGE